MSWQNIRYLVTNEPHGSAVSVDAATDSGEVLSAGYCSNPAWIPQVTERLRAGFRRDVFAMRPICLMWWLQQRMTALT